MINFEGRQVEYDFGDLDELSLAYALSIHKSQGSEYPCVVIPLHTQHYMMLQRNLLYTAVTRGKRLVVLVGIEEGPGPGRPPPGHCPPVHGPAETTANCGCPLPSPACRCGTIGRGRCRVPSPSGRGLSPVPSPSGRGLG